MTTTIDAHQHFWQLEPAVRLRLARRPGARADPPRLPARGPGAADPGRGGRPDDLRPDPARPRGEPLGPRPGRATPFLAGVVGWVDLASEDCERQVLEFRANPKFVGVRHVVQDEPDDDFLVREDVLRGLKVLEKHGVPFDLLFYVKHLRHVPTLARALPDLPMVIDHLAKPRIKDHALDDWLPGVPRGRRVPERLLQALGDGDRGGLGRLDRRRPAALRPGRPRPLRPGSPDVRLRLAGLRAGRDAMARSSEALVDALGPISEAERAAIFGGTATRFYGIEPPEPDRSVQARVGSGPLGARGTRRASGR